MSPEQIQIIHQIDNGLADFGAVAEIILDLEDEVVSPGSILGTILRSSR